MSIVRHDIRHETQHPELIEVVTPRTNAANSVAAENLFAAISLTEPFSLEIAATATARWFLARTESLEMQHHLTAQLAVAYPQATLRPLDLERYPSLDPARLGGDEQVAVCSLHLQGPAYLPIRTFPDREADQDHGSQADPVLGIVGALDGLPDGWRALTQLVLRPAPDDWARPYLRLALERPLENERTARVAHEPADTSATSVSVLAGLLVVGAIVLRALTWYDTGDWRDLGLLVGTLLALGGGVAWFVARLGSHPVYDPRLVAEKVSRAAFVCQIRIAVFAPREVSRARMSLRLERLVAAYRQYALTSGNSFRRGPIAVGATDLTRLTPFPRVRSLPILTTRELTGLWHLPRAQADVPMLERTTARERLPLPATVSRGCRIGVSTHQGRTVTVAIPDEVLRRHLLLIAKTRRGKSALLLRLARYLMERGPASGSAPAIVLVDPHQDLAVAALGLIPLDRRDDVVFLDVAQSERPFGLNLLDAGLGWSRDKSVANALAIFEREFSGFWGPRMEDAFRFGLLTLFEVNATICGATPEGRARQHTILDLPALLSDVAFRRGLVPHVADPVVKSWWPTYFDALDRRLQIEVINPVQTKVQRFAGSAAARGIVGQARSTIDPLGWIREGKIVIVNTAKGTVGEDTAALLGGTILNLVALAIAEQAALAPRDRRPISLLVDEFQSVPGANYEAILAELAKFGANLVLATQSLARLEALDRAHQRALRGTVFANLDGLFAFHCSAEDARYLVHELGEGVDEEDLVALGEHRCYARLSAGGERLPTFSIRLDPPPPTDPTLADALASASALRYGRPRHLVEDALRAAIERIEQCHRRTDPIDPGQAGQGIARDAATPADVCDNGRSKGKARNEKRNQRDRRTGPHQASFFRDVDDDALREPEPARLATLEDGSDPKARPGAEGPQ